MVRVCAETGEIAALVDAAEWEARDVPAAPPAPYDTGTALFALFRHTSVLAESGASPFLAAKLGRATVCTPATYAHLVFRLQPETHKHQSSHVPITSVATV